MASPKKLPPLEYLKECFTLSGGLLIWNIRPLHHFKTLRGQRSFNSQFSGKIAGTDGDRYKTVRIGDEHYKQHRVIAALSGEDVDGKYVDHKYGETFDNSPDSLRVVDHLTNMQNMKLFVTNKLGKSGLYILNNLDGTSFVRFQWHENGKRRNKSFSIKRYGYEAAVRLAEDFREQTYDRLNLQGAAYTERHGESSKIA
jgi:hypothetical protein